MRAAFSAWVVATAVVAVTPALGNTPDKPWLGVSIATNCQGVTSPGCLQGVRIDQVIDDTPAERADLRAGDVVIKIAGVEVDSAGKLIDEISKSHRVGEVVVLDVVRRGKPIEVQVTLDARLSDSELFARDVVGTASRDPWQPLSRVAGKAISSQVSSHRGDVVVVYLFATTCKSCKAITRALESLQATLGRRGLVVLAASEEPASTLAGLKTTLPLFADTGQAIRRTFASSARVATVLRGAVPIVAVVGRDGVITHAALGDEVDPVELRRAVERAVRVATVKR